MALGPILRETPGKLYVHVADVMRQRIENGVWASGTQIPTINALAHELDVAVVTIRQAVELLERDGLLKRRQGKGTFVQPGVTRKRIWMEMGSTWSDLVKKWEGMNPKILEATDNVTHVPLREGDGLPVPAYHYMRRVHSFEGSPYALVDLYLDMDIYSRAPARFDSQRVIPNIEAQPDITISSAKETLSVSEASVETAQLLDIRLHAPVAEVHRVVKNQRGFVIFLADCIYRGDTVNLERTFVR